MEKVAIKAQDIKELRASLKQSLSEFGLTLKRAIDPKAQTGYTRQYVSALEAGKFPITEELQNAYSFIMAAQDSERPELVATVPVTVYALPGQLPNNLYVPRAVSWHTCEYPGCGVKFIKTAHNQRYHIPKREHERKAKEAEGHMGQGGRPHK